MSTAPYADRADQAIRSTLRHALTATASHPAWGVIPLDLVAADLTFDEAWSPHIQGTVSIQIPDELTLSRLDPRTGVRVQVSVGYVYPDGTRDVHQLVDLGVRSRPVARPENTLSMSLASDEALMQDNAPTFDDSDDNFALYVAAEPIVPLIVALIGQAVAGAVVAVHPAVDAAVLLGVDQTLRAGEPFWPLVADLADRIGAWVYDDGAGTWHIDPRPVATAVSSTTLEVGRAGTVVSSRSELARDGEWANAAVVRYAADLFAYAKVTDGPFSVTASPRRVLVLDRSTITFADSSTARSILARAMTRGQTTSVTATAAYWLRPGHTVIVQLPLGAPARLLVSRVVFAPHVGEMTVDTRLPDNSTITLGV